MYIILPKLQFLYGTCFGGCTQLKFVTLEKVKEMDITCFTGCKLEKLELPKLQNINLNEEF